MYKFAKKLLLQIDNRKAEQLGSIFESTGFTKTEIIIPSSISSIIRSCTNKSEIIDEALNLRKSKDLVRFRRWLAEYEESTKNLAENDINNLNKMSKQITILENPVEYDVGSLIVSSLPSISDVISPNITKSIDKGVSIGLNITTAKFIEYLKTRNLVFYRNLSKQFDTVISAREHI